MGAIASQITSLTIVHSIVCSADQRKHKSSASLAVVRGIHRGPVNSPHKWPVTRKLFPFDDVIMQSVQWYGLVQKLMVGDVVVVDTHQNQQGGVDSHISVICSPVLPFVLSVANLGIWLGAIKGAHYIIPRICWILIIETFLSNSHIYTFHTFPNQPSRVSRQDCFMSTPNTLRSIQNGRHFTDDIFKFIFLNENVWISIKLSLNFVSNGPVDNMLKLVQIMAWRRTGDKPLSEPMMT